MFGSESALWFSRDGTNLAFVSFNDTSVDLIQYPIYGEPGMPDYQYPLLEAIPYPKVSWNAVIPTHYKKLQFEGYFRNDFLLQ